MSNSSYHADMAEALQQLLKMRTGHFCYESGHHGDLWIDLDGLFDRPEQIQPFANALVGKLEKLAIDCLCGPMTGGALLGRMVATAMNLPAIDVQRIARDGAIRYQIAEIDRPEIAGRRVALIDDVINAGSAASATIAEVKSAGGTIAALGALLILGDAAAQLAAKEHAPLCTLGRQDIQLWSPADCPQCRAGLPVESGDTPNIRYHPPTQIR